MRWRELRAAGHDDLVPHPPAPGPLSLVGSGEYLPVMTQTDGLLLQGRPPRYVQLPTAAAPEGEQSLRRCLDLGAAQSQRLGSKQAPVTVREPAQADYPELAPVS